MKSKNVVLAIIALAIVSQMAVALTVTIRPKHLSLSKDYEKGSVRCYLTLPEGYVTDDVKVENCKLQYQEQTAEATKVQVCDEDEGQMGADVVIFFDRDDVQNILPDGTSGDVELTLKIEVEGKDDLEAVGTITVSE